MNPAQKLKTIAVLPALTPLQTLRLIAQRSEALTKGEHGESARVTIFLQGATFTGFVSGIREEAEGSYVLLIEHDDSRTQSINIVYIPIWTIIAVRVHEAELHLHMLSGGKVDAPKATMGIVTLRTKIADEVLRLRTVVQADIKLEVSWETLTQDEVSLLGLYELIDTFMHVVQQVITDEFKRIAFKNIVSVIRFRNGKDAELQQEDQIIVVQANLKARSNGRFTNDEFRAALETLIADISAD